MTFDPFKDYDQRGYLRNVAGEKDVEIVKRLEHREFQINVGKALDRLSKIEILGYRDVLDTHKTLFAGVYPWAGQDRMETAPDIAISKAGKSDMFSYPRHVRRATNYALSQGQDRSFMRDKPGEMMGSLAHAHPFLDGNGRTIMTVHAELATRAGISVDWQKTDKQHYLKALTRELDKPGKGAGRLSEAFRASLGHTSRIRCRPETSSRIGTRHRGGFRSLTVRREPQPRPHFALIPIK